MQFPFQREHVGEDAQYLVVQRLVLRDPRLLRQIADLEPLRQCDGARVGRDLAGDDAEYGRLAAAVGAHQPDRLAGVQLQRHVVEHHPLAELLANVL